jgi:hypothetical protein
MTQQYALITTSLVSFFSITHVSNVASLCNTKIKSARISLVILFMLMGSMARGQQAMAYNFSTQIFKSQISFVNNYLDFASSYGIGGGGGGGHGNHEEVLWQEHANLFNSGLLSKNQIKNTI